ncbi:MAG: response regulator [Kofleriaceae bacterium]
MIGRKPRILNVNDRDVPRYVNEEMLSRAGYTVISVSSGAEALDRVADNIDLVLLDIRLPDIDGYEICRRIKAEPSTASVAVLLSSATFVTTSNKVTGLDSGADGYLAQPFEQTELLATIRSLLRTRAAERRASALAQELRHAITIRDEFLAMLGHELRNPIGAITTALHLIRENHAPNALAKYLPIMDRQVKSLTHLVDDLLDVARITQGKITLNRQVVDLREVLERCRESLGAEVLGSSHAVTIAIEGASTLVDGDPVRVEQIVTNLVTNAVKYTPRGGHVRLSLSHDDTNAILVVRDTGIGMDQKTLDRVFDVFAQGKQGLDRSRGGLGLGLTVVRRLVELHRGTIRAESAGEGKGSTFTLTLPLATQAAPRRPTPQSLPSTAPLAELRVLIVEDNADARESLAEVLRESCREVITAIDGKTGIEAAFVSRPDVMLVDIGLPLVDGYEVARRIRGALDGHRPHLIAMTGYGQPEDRQRALAAGFDSHIVKPISLPNLVAELAAVTGQ